MPIGVEDYDSLLDCLTSSWEQAFPGVAMRDPQNGIQQLAAAVMEQRRSFEAKLLDGARAYCVGRHTALRESGNATIVLPTANGGQWRVPVDDLIAQAELDRQGGKA